MSQEKIEEFPEGSDLWLIKWIDEFRLPHLGTRSTSVSVILQKLPFSDPGMLSAVKPRDIGKFLGKRHSDERPVLLFPLPRVMVGTLPLLHIGAVFQNKVRVGQLPTVMKWIGYLPGESEGIEVSVGQDVKPPPGWTPGLAHKILNAYEYFGLLPMPDSRCVVIVRREGLHKNVFVIPRTTIFKAFYAPHTEMAKAFCNGPWSESHEDVICLIDLESGLRTQAVNNNRQWNIILQTLVPKDFAEILAVFYFDPYPQACAESLYGTSQWLS